MKPKRLAKIMKALSNENRLALYLEIAKQQQSNFETEECSLSNIIKMFSVNKATISHHLKELSNAGLVNTEKRGKYLVATIDRQTLDEVKDVLGGIFAD